jgi:hypothetical protein
MSRRCPCGRDVAVPDLHALRRLKPAPPPPAPPVVTSVTLLRRAEWLAVGGTGILLAGLALGVFLSVTAPRHAPPAADPETIQLLSVLFFWFAMSAATLMHARAKGYAFSHWMLRVIFSGPIGWVVVLLLPPPDE